MLNSLMLHNKLKRVMKYVFGLLTNQINYSWKIIQNSRVRIRQHILNEKFNLISYNLMSIIIFYLSFLIQSGGQHKVFKYKTNFL